MVGEGGNVISFVSQLEAISYPQAILKLAKRAGIQTDFVANFDDQNQEGKYKSEYDLLEFTKDFIAIT